MVKIKGNKVRAQRQERMPTGTSVRCGAAALINYIAYFGEHGVALYPIPLSSPSIRAREQFVRSRNSASHR